MTSELMIGNSEAFLRALRIVEKLARLPAPVMIEGETGTGKELAARAIHYRGPRCDNAFVPINCGAIPDSLIESELFGHTKGAFTDAQATTVGLIGAADRGSLFLDEVDALSPKAQVALLRFLQDGSYRPVGGNKERVADVRIIAASNMPLDDLAASGRFRPDLLFRLRILTLRLPPLREREGDAILLAREFLRRCQLKYECIARVIDEPHCEWVHRYQWPGNVRELEGLVFREAMICEDEVLRLPAPDRYSGERRRGFDRRNRDFSVMSYSKAKAMVLQEFDCQYLGRLIKQTSGNVTQAARLAGKERRALGKLLKKHGLIGDRPGSD